MPDHHQSPSTGGAAGTRRRGRELALQALYQIEMTADPSGAAVERFLNHFEGRPKAKEFARRLVSGVVSQRPELDRLIEQYAENWKLDRIAITDLIILRIGAYELLFCADIPRNVSLNEAIEIAKRFGSMESAPFINGILDRVAQSATVKDDRS
ncbi:MAG TPA: transcription antitermination factor NusB [Candidatus Binatia bacterium]